VIAAAAAVQRWLANGVSALRATWFLLLLSGSILTLLDLTHTRRHMKDRSRATTPRQG
jgi:hypothetical protein